MCPTSTRPLSRTRSTASASATSPVHGAHGRHTCDGGGEAVVVDVEGGYRAIAGRGKAARRRLGHPAPRASDQRDSRRRRCSWRPSGAWNCMRTWSIEVVKTAQPGSPRLRSSWRSGGRRATTTRRSGGRARRAGSIDHAVRGGAVSELSDYTLEPASRRPRTQDGSPAERELAVVTQLAAGDRPEVVEVDVGRTSGNPRSRGPPRA